jgi:DNA excision repair protein ERCC-2
MAIKIEDHHVSLGVRDLLQPAASRQMLSSFPLPQRGLLGRQAQTKVQEQKSHRFGLFHSEYSLRRDYLYSGYTFTIQGRIDGVYQLRNRVEIEEIKSVILTAAEFKNLSITRYPEFIEQVLIYAYLLQDELQGREVSPFLILINLINNARRSFPIAFSRPQVERFLFERFNGIITGIEREEQELQRRRDELSRIDFNLPEDRPQQRQMMQMTSDCLEQKRHLMASAPTGTGKTAAALIPAIQYAYTRRKKIFFITSKTTQQRMVEQTLQPLIEQQMDLRVLYLRAAEKMCANDIFFCHEAYCPYARDYQERLLASNVVEELLENRTITPDLVYQKAIGQMLCPFEVSMDCTPHVDIITGDYNYVFDPAVYLRRLFNKKDFSDWILIIDEAHNLYPRGMDYLSPALGREKIQTLTNLYGSRRDKTSLALHEALQEILNLLLELQTEGEAYHPEEQYFKAGLNVQKWADAGLLMESAFIQYLIHKIRKHILIMDDPVESLYYQLRRFVQVAQFHDRAFVPFYDARDGGILKIQCCDPSIYLGQRIEGFHTVIAMSATLDPIGFYQDTLGFSPSRTEIMQLDSPFPSGNRRVVILPHISARYNDRSRNYPKIAGVIENIARIRSGNYLVFFPSFDFVQNVNLFLSRLPGEKILQRPGMNEDERDHILQKLKNNGEAHVLLGVMGGVFSEGVDFYGDMAIGVIIISPGLPQVSYERELLREYYEEKNGQGFEYAYIYPGMNKVIQAVGRLIRSATDRGVVALIDERFAEERYQALLPGYWFKDPDQVVISEDYVSAISEFWQKFAE